jgi:His-Xaa-Ser system radical SAM maturase HxsC
MINLTLKVSTSGVCEPVIVRLNRDWGLRDSEHDVFLVSSEQGRHMFARPGIEIAVRDCDIEDLDGDVVLVSPESDVGHRLLRASSPHNTLLMTERCDQLCIMCSQPPKKTHLDFIQGLRTAILLAPPRAAIGISGGEPLLYKADLFGLLDLARSSRPDLTFHVLTNGQHFAADDVPFLRGLPSGLVTWGIPLYSAVATTHDVIVRKSGAFALLMQSMALLGRAGGAVELRSVVMRQNVADLPDLAKFVANNLPFAASWAIMQLEPAGFARGAWRDLFFDTSLEFTPLAEAISVAAIRGLDVQLFNFPLCAIPDGFRSFAVRSISDWKQKYLPECASCRLQRSCGGFFEWYVHQSGFAGIQPL